MSGDELGPEVHERFMQADAARATLAHEISDRKKSLPHLRDEISQILGHDLNLADHIQDAGFFAYITLRRPHKGSTRIGVSYTFSLFGNLVSVYVDPTWVDAPSSAQLEAVAELLSASHHVLVSSEDASHPYTGKLRNGDGVLYAEMGDRDWNWRFFDYE